MIKSRKQMYLAIGAFALVLMLGTVTYAFFNYTRTGSANTIRTGRIAFNSQQGNSINLTNVFPVDVSNGIPNNNPNVGSVTINVTGDTTYGEGVEYLVSAVNVQNTIGSGANAKNIPISIDVSVANNTVNDPATTLGTSDTDYFTNRGANANTSIYKVLAGETISTDNQLLVGYIKSGEEGIDGYIVIKAYIDKAKVGISDTYPEEEANTNNDGYIDGTPASFGENREIFTTTEWNSLQTNGVSFQIKVESQEGIWVENPNLAKNVIEKVTGLRNVAGAKRYVGGNTTTNNYVYFNGNEKWRIIGVYGDQLKIIKAENPINIAYNEYSETATNAWEGSTVETYLNGDYYDGLTSAAKEMIAEGTWNIGKTTASTTAINAYSSAQTDIWTGQVGLIAAYEYLYATGMDNCDNVSGNYGNYNACGQVTNNWLSNEIGTRLTITGTADNFTTSIQYAPYLVDVNYIYVNNAAFPVVYLKSSVVINGGDGSINTPYELQ